MLIDTHCHIDILKYGKNIFNIEKLLYLCEKNNFLYLLSVSTNLKNFFSIFSMLSYMDMIKLSCGIHPYYVQNLNNNDLLDLEKFVSYNKIIAVGETGLDYKNNVSKKNKNKQIDVFFYHLYLSVKYCKPCIIHSRNSYKDILNIIKKFDISKCGAVIHCYNYTNRKILSYFLDLGLYISLSGLITFKNTILLQDIVKYIPNNRLLVETDSPYLSPYPFRGKYNNPLKIIFVFKKISKLKKISFYKVIKINVKNFFKLFKIR